MLYVKISQGVLNSLGKKLCNSVFRDSGHSFSQSQNNRSDIIRVIYKMMALSMKDKGNCLPLP